MRFHHAFALSLANQILPSDAMWATDLLKLTKTCFTRMGTKVENKLSRVCPKTTVIAREQARNTCSTIFQKFSEGYTILKKDWETHRNEVEDPELITKKMGEGEVLIQKFTEAVINLPERVAMTKELAEEFRNLDWETIKAAANDEEIRNGFTNNLNKYVYSEIVTGVFSPVSWATNTFTYTRPDIFRSEWLEETRVDKKYGARWLEITKMGHGKGDSWKERAAETLRGLLTSANRLGNLTLKTLIVLPAVFYVDHTTGLGNVKDGVAKTVKTTARGMFWDVIYGILTTPAHVMGANKYAKDFPLIEDQITEDKKIVLEMAKIMNKLEIIGDPTIKDTQLTEEEKAVEITKGKAIQELMEMYEAGTKTADNYFTKAVFLINTTLENMVECFEEATIQYQDHMFMSEFEINMMSMQGEGLQHKEHLDEVKQVFAEVKEEHDATGHKDCAGRRRLASRPGYGQSMERLVKEEHRCTCAM